ncbi:similar to Saccharomyces cerevisiae YNL158W PGA1 Essential component of GPI-mannosyltransferase II, responsible for second mannose addition to GPI precursors as a partner of Gpi18p [Maudiozyma saulgeensis]|uniref:Similar to Saccharomyces cerevisiae YNL158W PGA1 Essential component of GPI-mannosyltransferase II, responsible for second mannose addition to GPIs as a partner of Gpi18p n=1 Tax=Maudiozyma saulgeensis TaxID=1789683 RepID=A0A1X7R025_9SACH|nr:similar to Saccharomyces cerevisiae YNL158W PGA1 Essential component of GPI-mannosyltransferase II, responsible for second mannose addition to GPI precursors as a partner of Gpi18p [Kazachstania saulgeensis]
MVGSNVSFTWLLFILINCLLCVVANTETFQVSLPRGDPIVNIPSIINTELNIWSLDISSNVIDSKPILLRFEYDNAINSDSYDMQLYSFKICWSAITPISYKSESFIVNHTTTTDNEQKLIYEISFIFENDSYPKIDLNESIIIINCSLNKLIWGFLPSELLPIILTILITLLSIISFYKIYLFIY